MKLCWPIFNSWRWKEKKNLRTEDTQKISGGKKAFKHLVFIRWVYQECRKIKNLKKIKPLISTLLCDFTAVPVGIWGLTWGGRWYMETLRWTVSLFLLQVTTLSSSLQRWSLPGLNGRVSLKGVRDSKYAVSMSGRGCHCPHTSWLQAENCSKLFSYRPCQDILNSF